MTQQDGSRDDQHPSDVVRPDEWLCDEYFRGQNWIESVTKIVEAGWREKKVKRQRVLQKQDIERLRHIVAKFIHARVTWEGFLSKTEATELIAIKGAAGKLLSKLRKLGSLDNGDERPTTPFWYIEGEISDNPAETKAVLDRFLQILDNLSQMPVSSPRISKTDAQGTGQTRDHAKTVSQDATNDKQQGWSKGLPIARIELQRDLDDWWKRVTGLPLAKSDFKAKAFHDFLSDLYGRVRLPNAPGASETAIAEARRTYRDWERAEHERFLRMSSSLKNIMGEDEKWT